MAFEKLTSFTKKVSDLADKPTISGSELKAQFDAAPEELRQYFNKLIDGLSSGADGNSGAKNIGVTAIKDITGNDIQTLLEYLAAHKVSKDGGDTIDGELTIKGTAKGLLFDVGKTNKSGVYWNANSQNDFGLVILVDGTESLSVSKDGTILGKNNVGINAGKNGNAYVTAPDGVVYLKSNNSMGVYVVNINQNVFMPINASSFNVNSDRNMKKNITLFEEDALQLINSTPVYQYHYKNELDNEMKHTGLIMQEAPVEINSINGVGIDDYAMGSVAWRGIQQLSDENKQLKTQIADILERLIALESQK